MYFTDIKRIGYKKQLKLNSYNFPMTTIATYHHGNIEHSVKTKKHYKNNVVDQSNLNPISNTVVTV